MLISKQYIKMAEATQKASITKDKESEITTITRLMFLLGQK